MNICGRHFMSMHMLLAKRKDIMAAPEE